MSNLAVDIELDRGWLRRIRGKLDAAEIQKAKDLADESIKSWIREIFGSESVDEEMETILDDNDETLDVADEVITDLFANPGEDYYKQFVLLAEAITSYHLVQWGDFMGKNEESGGTAQDRAINANINRIKSEILSVGFLITSDGNRRHFNRASLKRDGFTQRRSARR